MKKNYNEQNYWKFLLEILTLVSLANNIGSDTEFIFRGRSIIHTMNNLGPGIDPWGTPCFNVTQFREKILSCMVILPHFLSCIK